MLRSLSMAKMTGGGVVKGAARSPAGALRYA